jgi:hypothetical protein
MFVFFQSTNAQIDGHSTSYAGIVYVRAHTIIKSSGKVDTQLCHTIAWLSEYTHTQSTE